MALPLNVNLADKFSSKLDQAFKLSSFTDAYVNKEYEFDGVNKISVYTLDTTALKDYDMSNTSNRYGGFSEITDTVAEYTLSIDKAFQKALDTANKSDSFQAKTAANWLALQMNMVIVPAIDKQRFLTAFNAAAGANGGGDATYVKATVLEQIQAMNATCDEMSVPSEGRVLFVTPTVWNDIKAEVTPLLNNAGDAIVRSRGLGGTIDGIDVVCVPSNLFPATCNALFWHKGALLAARKLTETKILDGGALVSGNIIQGRFRYDSWALKGFDNASQRYTKLGTFQSLVTPVTPTVTSITVTPATASIAVGATATPIVVVAGTGAYDDTWTVASGDETKATVDAEGVITGVAAGEATITYTSVGDGTKTDTCVVTVTAE
jgi:hypothetical protein